MLHRRKLLAATLPRHTELEYIESIGDQYINTGLQCNQDSIISLTSLVEYNYLPKFLFGNITTIGQRVSIVRGYTTQAIYFGDKYLYNNTIPAPDYVNPEVFVLQNGLITINGVSYSMGVSSDFTSPDLYLFKCPSNNIVVKGKVYNLTMTIDDVVHEIIPVLDKDGVPCFYDKARKLYLYNEGEGVFLYGLKS